MDYSIHVNAQVDALKKLRKILEKGSFMGAGLSIGVSVGAKGESICFSITEDDEVVLKALVKALEQTLGLSKVLLKSKIADLNKALENVTYVL